MKRCQFALLLMLSLTAHRSISAQALPAGAVLVASEGLPGGDSFFPDLLRGAHESLAQGMGMSPALSQGLQAAEKPAPSTPEPLTAKQRLNLFWNETYATPGLWAGVAGGAMIDQVRHTPLKWDGDGGGYTRRFASEYGQLAARSMIHDGLAGVAGLDPRYQHCKCQRTMRRGAHALMMGFTTYRQDGRLTLDVPQIAGAYGSGMVSTFWFPHSEFKPMIQGVQFGHEQMGEIVVNNLVQEFGPDIQRRLHLHALIARMVSNPDDDD